MFYKTIIMIFNDFSKKVHFFLIYNNEENCKTYRRGFT